VVASPNLTLNITPPGGATTNYAANLTWSGASQTPTIMQNFGRQGDTALLVLTDDWAGLSTPHFYIPVLSQVQMIDNTIGQTIFAGVISDPQQLVAGANINEWILQCTDYTYYADNAIVHGIFDGLTADQIIIALTKQANCGISAASIANGGFVAPAPVLAQVVLNYTTLSSAWRTLAQLAGSVTPYGWYVDEQRRLHFFDPTTALSSGVTVTTTPTSAGAGSATECHLGEDTQFSYEWDGGSIRNRIIIQGANQTFTADLKKAPTDTWVGNGVQNSWPLRYTVTGNPALVVGGKSTSLTVATGGQTSTAPWVVQQNAFGQWFLIAQSAPGAGVVVKIWYDYLAPVVAQANDIASQVTYTGPNGGVYTEYINDSSLTTVPMALARAMRERTEYAFAAERTTFNTTEEFIGYIRAGQTFQYVNRFVPDAQAGYTWGINDSFITISNTVTFTRGGYRTMNITGVRL